MCIIRVFPPTEAVNFFWVLPVVTQEEFAGREKNERCGLGTFAAHLSPLHQIKIAYFTGKVKVMPLLLGYNYSIMSTNEQGSGKR